MTNNTTPNYPPLGAGHRQNSWKFGTLVKCLKGTLFLPALMLFADPAEALEEIGPVQQLSSLHRDQRSVGWQWHYIDASGNAGHMTKVAGTATHATYERSDGCRWTRPITGFAPANDWANCPSTGSATVEFESGDIWPLAVGKTFSYSIKGHSSLLPSAWKSKRRCEITNTVRVRIHAGDFDTYKVRCTERWGTRTWWMSPDIGTAVAYEQRTRRGGYQLQEFVKISLRDDSK